MSEAMGVERWNFLFVRVVQDRPPGVRLGVVLLALASEKIISSAQGELVEFFLEIGRDRDQDGFLILPVNPAYFVAVEIFRPEHAAIGDAERRMVEHADKTAQQSGLRL